MLALRGAAEFREDAGVDLYRPAARNFAARIGDFRSDLVAATKPITIISGADDELMVADKYAEPCVA